MEFTKEQQEAIDELIAERLASETEGLKHSQKQLIAEKRALQARAAAFEGLDPDEVRGLQAKFAEMEAASKAAAAGITSEALAKIRTETAAEFEKKYGPVLQENERFKGENRSLKLDSVVKAQMAKAGARAERIDALFKLTADRFDLTQDGQPMVRDATKEVSKYIVEDVLKEYPEFFQGSGSSGGGAAKSTGGAGGVAIVSDGAGFMANLKGVSEGKVSFVP